MRLDTMGIGAGGLLLGSMSMLLPVPPKRHSLLRSSPSSYLASSSSSSSLVTPDSTSSSSCSSSSSPPPLQSSSSSSSSCSSSSSSAFLGTVLKSQLPHSTWSSSSPPGAAPTTGLRMGLRGVWGALRRPGAGGRGLGGSKGAFQQSRGAGERRQDVGQGSGSSGSSDYQQLSSTALGAAPDAEAAAKGADDVKRVLLLISDTGGGHRASATALEDALNKEYSGKVQCDIVDIWTQHAAWPYTKFVPAYKFLAKHPFMWRIFWWYGQMPISRLIQEKATLISCFHRFKKAIASYDPDMVVSVHPLCQDIPLRALGHGKKGGRKLPFATVVTDLGGAHPLWFDRRVDLCFVPSNAVRRIAEKAGLKQQQIRQHGLPLRSGFWNAEKRSKTQVRKDLGLKEGLPTTLVVGGGDGVGGITRIAEALAKSLGECDDCVGQGSGGADAQQLVVVCGNNEKIARQLRERAAKNEWGDGVVVNVQGFVSNMEDFMAASDCIVTKAGPGTIAESMCRGLPTMLSCYLPGQEAGNVPFVTEGGFGDYSKDPETIASTVASWMRDPAKLEEMSQRASAGGRPSATNDIARELGECLFNGAASNVPDQRLGGAPAVA